MSQAEKKKNGRKWHKKIEKLLLNAGFKIVESDYFKKGPDIIAEAENHRVIVQCKCAEEEGRSINVGPLVDEYSKKVEKENAMVAILALSRYKIPEEYEKLEEKERVLKEDRVTIWDDNDYEYYKRVVDALGAWARFPLLGDLGCTEEFSSPISVPAMKINQGIWEFFVFTISPENLLKIADVLRRVRNPNAYQRIVSKKRVRDEVREFLERPEAIFPTNLVCVFRAGVDFDEQKQKLVIPMKYSSVWIVDGQHRLYAFCHVKDENRRKKFNLMCTGFNVAGFKASHLDREHQADVFVNINQQAKRAPKELLIAIALSFGMADRRMKIVEGLKGTKIFKKKIKSIDTKGKIDITTFVETAPMRRLVEDRGVLSKWYGRKRELKEIPHKKEENFLNFCFKLFQKYFSIVREMFPNEWENPKEFIQATNRGIRGLLRIMEYILEFSDGLKNVEKAKECFKCLRSPKFDFSTTKLRRMYLGEGGADGLADLWVGIIQDSFPDFGPRSEVIREEQIQPNQKVQAEEIIKDVLTKLDGEVIGELKFIEPTTFKYLSFIPLYCPIRIFIDGTEKDELCRQEAEKLAEERGGAPMEIRYIRRLDKGPYIHDRWLADGKVMIDFGTDLKEESLGKSSHRIIVTSRSRIAPRYRTFQKLWGSTPGELENKGAKCWSFYKSKRF